MMLNTTGCFDPCGGAGWCRAGLFACADSIPVASAVWCLVFAVCYLLSAVCCLLFSLLSTVCYLLFTAWCLLPVAFMTARLLDASSPCLLLFLLYFAI
jgi:hypothetical protein